MICPNLETALRIYLCVLSTNASGKRSLFVLQRVKNYLRNLISNDHLSALDSFSVIKDPVNAHQLRRNNKNICTTKIVLCNVK